MNWYLVHYNKCKNGHVRSKLNIDRHRKCKICTRIRRSSPEYREQRLKNNTRRLAEDPTFRLYLRKKGNKWYKDNIASNQERREKLNSRARKVTRTMHKGYIARLMDTKVEHMTDELYELKCLSLLLTRQERKTNVVN